ncbi:MAG: hypothetical protein E6J55_02815 [Deltaproteobacteria bacterium]|nr:MAG: hypothetical protein E6J55_02815 [Deltaproteobacteria bacterium]
MRIQTRRLRSATSVVAGAIIVLALSGQAVRAQPLAARDVEPVVLTGKQVRAWSGPAAEVTCTPVAASPGRDAHKGTVIAPPATGVPVDQVVAFKWDGLQWVEIPVQVDQMYYYCLGNPNSQTFGQFYSQTDKELTYAWDVEAWKKTAGQCSATYPSSPPSMTGPMPDPVSTLDDDDEIVFMARDTGAQVPLGTLPPPGTSNGQAVAITDPLDPSSVRFVYLFLRPGGSAFNTSNGYVSYVRDADADEWIDKCSFRDDSPEKLGSSNSGYGPNLSGTVCRTASSAPGGCPNVADGTPRPSTDRFPRDGVTVNTDTYQWHASGRWMVRSLQITKPNQTRAYGPDLIDRWKGRAFQQSPDSTISLVGFEDEQVNWEGNNALLGERAGPVRAIREIWGADSGTNVTKTETFYRDVITYHYHVRVHPIPPDGLYTSWDYNRGVVSKYYNTIKPDGVDIDGMNDDTGNVDGVFGMPAYFDAPDPTFNAPTAVLNWEEVSGASDNGSLVYIVEIKGATTAENPAVVPYYRDDSCLDDGTGDDPVSRPWPGEASDDTRVMNGYCAAAGKPNGCHVCRSATDPGPCDVDCKLGQTQGAHAAHGIHYFFSNDTDNLAAPEDITEIDAQQWQFTVPTPQPTNVGQPYGNDVIAPLEAAVVSIVALPAVTTTTLPEITTTTLPEVTTTTLPGVTTTTLPGLTTTTTPATTTTSTTTTSTTLPNPAPPSAASASAATDQDTAVDITLSGADLNDCELTFSIVTPPGHGTLGSITNHACSLGLPSSDTATVTYTPAAGFHGSDSFTYTVNDGSTDSSPATVSITVRQTNPATCANGPASGCRRPTRSRAASLSLRDRSPDRNDRLTWRWGHGAATSKTDFGNPLATTDYQLCVYDGNGHTIARGGMPPGGTCGGRPCWRETATRFTYGRGGSSSISLRLRPGPDGKAEIVARGTGVALDLSPLPASQPVTVQLKNNEGKCWEATFSAPAIANGPGKFADRSD